jgi:hypothetical protein
MKKKKKKKNLWRHSCSERNAVSVPARPYKTILLNTLKDQPT